jgi:hypothetical protein
MLLGGLLMLYALLGDTIVAAFVLLIVHPGGGNVG